MWVSVAPAGARRRGPAVPSLIPCPSLIVAASKQVSGAADTAPALGRLSGLSIDALGGRWLGPPAASGDGLMSDLIGLERAAYGRRPDAVAALREALLAVATGALVVDRKRGDQRAEL